MPAQRDNVISVIPFAGFEKELDYRIPDRFTGDVRIGSLVRIPIRNRQSLGVVAALEGDSGLPPSRLKQITQLIHDEPVLTEELVALARWMRDYYAAPVESIMETMIPGPVRRGMKPKVENYLSVARKVSSGDLEDLRKKAPKQAELYTFLAQQFKPQKKSLVLSRTGVAAASCRALVTRGWVKEEARRLDREAYRDDLGGGETVSVLPPELNEEQEAAASAMLDSLRTKAFRVHLLQGVTGSGKTEVYIKVLREALNDGGGAIFLVPEVALAPQTVGRLRARLEKESGVRTVVWHSHLSEGERFDAWNAVVTGEARLVVGARSAVFAPVPDLRMIVVDEEHEPAYKQEEVPRYHGRDVAVYRAWLNRALCVLGSATPSLESLRNVSEGKYVANRLLKRVDDRRLPMIHVVDMCREILSKRGAFGLSRPLVDKMIDRFEKKEQTILFINRRGYSSSVLCPDCGHVLECEHCSVSLTYHRSDETVKCHLCGHQRPAPKKCPSCRSVKIRWKGFGTQRVEDAVRKVLPKASIERMDTDAMSKRNRFREILRDFRLGKIDVLVGTQMIAKGLDFPNVTLVGLVDADLSLHVPDFRAHERTFQLLVQVSGRSGRGDRAGEVVVQTFTPHAGTIQYARREDFDGFIEEEMESRRSFQYPPFRHLIHHLFHGPNPEKLEFYTERWVRHLEEKLPEAMEIRGPCPAPLEKVKDRYRYQVWYFTHNVTRLVPKLQALRREFPWPDDVVQVLDVDAVNLT